MAETVPPEYARLGCAFCDSDDALTREHIWPKWMGSLLSNRFDTKAKAVTELKERDGQSVNKWRSDRPTLTSKLACSHCNNGWMSNLEEAAKGVLSPILFRPDALVLFTPSQLRLLAAYAMQKAMIADWMNEYPRLFFRKSERHSFADCVEMPSACQIWLGGMLRIQGVIGAPRYEGKTESGDEFQIQPSLFGCGHVLFSVVGFRWRSRALRRRTPAIGIHLDPNYRKAFIPIWPAANRALWPPYKALDESELAFYARDYWSRSAFRNALT